MSGVKWETCEVHLMDAKSENVLLALLSIPAHKFVARANGPKGPFIAGESEIIEGEPNSLSSEHVSVLDSFITKLKGDGWEYVGTGENWWSYKYRRKGKS